MHNNIISKGNLIRLLFIDHIRLTGWPVILTVKCVIRTSVRPVKKFNKSHIGTLEIESLIRIWNVLFIIEFCRKIIDMYLRKRFSDSFDNYWFYHNISYRRQYILPSRLFVSSINGALEPGGTCLVYLMTHS